MYLDEEQMRLEGYDKTPDIRLKVPISKFSFSDKLCQLPQPEMLSIS